MAYARMRAKDTDALICDFAQYYGMDMEKLPLGRAAVLACGLPEESRTKMLISGRKLSTDTMCRAAILDALHSIEYAYIKTHSKSKVKKPKSLLKQLTSGDAGSDVQAFDSSEGFEAAKRRITGV